MAEKRDRAKLTSILISYSDVSWKKLNVEVHFVLNEIYEGAREYVDIHFYVIDSLLASVEYPVE